MRRQPEGPSNCGKILTLYTSIRCSPRDPADYITYVQARYDKHVDRFFIATGIMNERPSSSVIIWTSASGGHDANEESEDDLLDEVHDTYSRVSASVALYLRQLLT